ATDVATLGALPEGIKQARSFGVVAAPLRVPLKASGIGLSATEELVKAGGPSVTDLKFPQTIDTAAQRLSEQNSISPIKTVQDLADGAHDAADRLWTQEYAPKIARHAAQTIDGSSIADGMVNNISSGTAELFPEEADKIVDFASKLDKPLTLPKAQEYLQTLNTKLKAFYKMTPEARHAALISDGQLAAYEGAVDGLKNQIDAKLE